MHFSAEARRRYLDFATSTEAAWHGNFRDLNGSITRLCTLAESGRITEVDVDGEIARLRSDWRRDEPFAAGGAGGDGARGAEADDDLLRSVLGDERLAALDRFDRVQLAEVVRCCRSARSLSAAGRELFAVTRQKRATANDADRLRKYLARFGLDHAAVVAGGG